MTDRTSTMQADPDPQRPDSPAPTPAPSIPPTPDDARARPDPIKKPATGGSAGSGNAVQNLAPDSGKVIAPSSDVEVPRMPARPDADTPDEAGKYGKPRIETGHDSNWADNVKPKPDAKNARSSLF